MRELKSEDGSGEADRPLLQTSSFALENWLRPELLALFGIFVVFYFFKLSFFSLSIDDELGALQVQSRVWVLTGRWAGYFFDKYLMPQSTVPYLPVFLFGFFATLSYPVLLRALGVRRLGGVHLLTYPLYVAFPIWSFLAAFAANIASAGVGLLCVTLAAAQFRRGCDGTAMHTWSRSVALGALYVAVAMGFYQSFFFMFLASVTAIVLTMWLAAPRDVKFLLKCAAVLTALTVCAVVIYAVVDNALRAWLGLQDRTYLANFLDWRTLVESPLNITLRVATSMVHVYGGFSDVYGLRAVTYPLLIVVAIAAMLTMRAMQLARRIVALLMMAVMLGIPFLQHFLAGGDMPLRTLIAVPCVFWFFTLIALTSLPPRIAMLFFFVVLAALFQTLYSSTLLEAANRFARVHDQELSGAVYDRIAASNPEFNPSETYYVDFFGAKSFDTVYPRPPSSTAGFSFFEWGGGDDARITDYMRLIGFSNLRPATVEQHRHDRPIFESMPVWPAPGSVRTFEGVTLIKLNAQSVIP
jgi:Glucosyl transferase GtrII